MHAAPTRIEQDLNKLNECNATPGAGLTRLTYTKEHAQARTYLVESMRGAGLAVREDAMGNLIGRREGKDAHAPAIAIGSHFDSVRNGGMFDGDAGIVAGLEVARILQETDTTLTHPFEVIAIVEEEGGRFGSGMLGGRAIAGLVPQEALDAYRDSDGITIRQAMADFGLRPEELAAVKRTRADMLAFLELHIEQGPVLEKEGLSIGLVETIVGISVQEFTITGRPDHAGTTPMHLRQDALVAAAQVITAVNQSARELNDGTVSTVGIVQVQPCAVNVVPGRVTFTVGIRSGKESSIAWMEERIAQTLQKATEEAGMQVETKRIFETKPVHMAAGVVDCLKQAAEKLELPMQRMQSGAGHDSMFIAHTTDVGMLFVPSKAGRSHCPEEWTDFVDIAKGTELLFETVLQLDSM